MKWQIISGWMEHVDMPLDFYERHDCGRDAKSWSGVYGINETTS